MSDITQPRKPALLRNLPVIGILLVAVIGFFTLRDYLSFQTLADNREALIAFRDDNYLLTALALIAVYVLVVAFSLPGASIATLTSGFLFGPVFGAIFSVL
ncbi:MAG: TVP38/TMEM64 family protein, partial [Pseudomonadota bacterium]